MPSNTASGPWWRINALASDPRAAEILIYSDIGESWDDSTVAARTFVESVGALDVDTLTVRINSYGGSVPDGLAIYNALRRHPASVAVEIDGIAASIASLIAMAGDRIHMAANAMLMIHAPWAMAIGNAAAMRETADTLDRYAQAMSASYARAGFSRDDALALLTDGADHWYTADEALAAGLIDTITPALAIAASVPTRFRPAAAAAPQQEATMATTETPAAPEQPTADNLTEINAKAVADARAALIERNTTVKARFDAFCQAFPGRVEQIRPVFDAAMTDIEQTPEQFTAAVLAKMAEKPDEPVVGAYSVRVSAGEDQRDKLAHACADALLVRASVPLAQRPDLNGNPFRAKRLAGIAEDSLKRAGIRTENMDQRDIVAAAFTQSTSDFPVLMENVMHKALLSGYALASLTWRRFCAIGSVGDFRAHNRYLLGSLGDLEDLNEAGEFKNQTIPDGRKQSVSIGTKGAIINLTRQAIINDDLGAFVGLAAARGQAAARTIENAVYAALALNSGYGPLLSDGKSIIHADHGNIAATTGAPSVATVEAGLLKMSGQKDISGNDYLDLRPSIALVPTHLEVTTRVLNTSTNDPAAATGSTKNPNIPNPFNGFFADIVASRRLADTKWYMLADPSVAPVLEVSFLDGNQEPFMVMETGFTVDGARWKTRLDFGVSGVGYEGIVYNSGQ